TQAARNHRIVILSYSEGSGSIDADASEYLSMTNSPERSRRAYMGSSFTVSS
ncbi:MAG: hypothetical protein QOF78_3767, partial [Phycisphaerales bacterium]|nr:hypothetical protein [Phycisphaerales bacterium]